MNFLWITLLSTLFLSPPSWETDLPKAEQTARTEHKLILLNFSGSDWCGPCIRWRQEVLDNEIFSDYANTSLVLVNADFPRLKKHQLPKELQQKNNQLADTYNPKGIFPLTLLLSDDGRVLRSWEGNPGLSPQAFTEQVKAISHAGH
jgi:hypothetical protein